MKFVVLNPNGIDKDLFELIKLHYTRLHLFKRFEDNMDKIITSLTNSIKASLGSQSDAEIIKTTLKKCTLDKQAFGFNFWEAILQETLVVNQDYWDQIIYEGNLPKPKNK